MITTPNIKINPRNGISDPENMYKMVPYRDGDLVTVEGPGPSRTSMISYQWPTTWMTLKPSKSNWPNHTSYSRYQNRGTKTSRNWDTECPFREVKRTLTTPQNDLDCSKKMNRISSLNLTTENTKIAEINFSTKILRQDLPTNTKGERSELSVGKGMENSYCRVCPLVIQMSAYVPYVHNPEVHGRFYGLDLKKEIVVLYNKPCMSLD